MHCFWYRAPNCILEPERNDGLQLTVEANTVSYEEVEENQKQIKRHTNVQHEEDTQQAHGRREEFKIDSSFDAYLENSIKMMTEFEPCWMVI